MTLVFLFRRLIYAQILLGLAAFCIAERNPGMLLVAGSVAALSWYVVEGPSGKPLPQLVTLPMAMGAIAWLAFEILPWQNNKVIVAVGHFTMWLQIIQLYGHK